MAFAFLSDLHNADPDPIMASLYERKPEIILISGDLVRGDDLAKNGLKTDENPNAMKLLRGCAGLAPTFVSLGNHEWVLSEGDLQAIIGTGAVLLDNCWTRYKGMFIGGLSSAWFTRYQSIRLANTGRLYSPKLMSLLKGTKPVPDISWLDDFEKLDGWKLLLCHHPEYYPKYIQSRKIDLVCSGHCHGGQWRYYSRKHQEWRGVYGPGQGLFPKYTSGIHDGRLLISRGLSNTAPVPRFNNPPEVIYVGMDQVSCDPAGPAAMSAFEKR